MAVGIKAGAVIDQGGNQLFLYEVDPTTFAGATLTVGTYLFNLSFIGNSDIAQTTDETETEYEDGDKITVGYTYTVMFTATLKQTDADLIVFLGNTIKGKVYLVGKYTGYVNTVHQWWYSIMKIKPQFSIKRPGGAESMPFEGKSVKLGSSVEFSAATMASIGNLLTLSNYPTVTLTITTSKRFAMIEGSTLL